MAMGDLRQGAAEGREIVGLRLVHEDVAIGEEQDALLDAGFPEPPDDLESRVGLAGARGHDQQISVLAPCNRLDGSVDGRNLIVTGLLAASVHVVVLGDDLFCFGCNALPRTIALPKFSGRWESVE